MALISKHTRFRAYQLKTKGSSFSYWDGINFILCEARYNSDNKSSILHELSVCGKTSINTLHLTSWDNDHCNPDELHEILYDLRPARIECPGYDPHSDSSTRSALIIEIYKRDTNSNIFVADRQSISNLNNASEWDYSNIFYNNPKNNSNPNDNSSIKVFRSGCFNILSLGDCESETINQFLSQSSFISNEVDILLLSHHGSDNALNSPSFLDFVKPFLAIALCNWSNQHGHPDQNVLRRLSERDISYYSTKQGDVIIESVGNHLDSFQVWNYISDGDRLESVSGKIRSKKSIHWYNSFV